MSANYNLICNQTMRVLNLRTLGQVSDLTCFTEVTFSFQESAEILLANLSAAQK